MGKILSGERGMAGLVLIVLIAWALLSVIFLTGTLLAARSIDRSVTSVTKPGINPIVEDIGSDAKFIDQARIIADTSGKILTAAKPLSGQLDVVDRTAERGIDPKLKKILRKVNRINAVAGAINTNVLQIGSTVDSILGNASSINGSVLSINARGKSILRSAREINGSATGILGDAAGILGNVQTIDNNVARANGQATTIDDTAAPIAKDLNDVLGLVGRSGSGGHGGTIHGHANGIDCSTLINGTIGGLVAPVADLLAGLGITSDVPGQTEFCNQ